MTGYMEEELAEEEFSEEAAEASVLTATADGTRLDALIAAQTALTRSRAAQLIEQGMVTIGGKTAKKASEKPAKGETVTITLPAPKPALPQPQDIPLHILYEDDDLAVVEKPCGMVVHPAPGNEDGTLVNALLFHLKSLSGIGGEMRPGIVHRLDKDTSGLLLVAKNDFAQAALSAQLSARQMEKHYRALVEGNIKEDKGRVEQPLARSKNDRKKMAIDPSGREAITEYTVLERGKNATLLDVHILTGRTHQIRVHTRFLHHPVCGDPIYGFEKGNAVPRLMLHAYSLSFTHPRSGERMTVVCDMPEAFVKTLHKYGINVTNLK